MEKKYLERNVEYTFNGYLNQTLPTILRKNPIFQVAFAGFFLYFTAAVEVNFHIGDSLHV